MEAPATTEIVMVKTLWLHLMIDMAVIMIDMDPSGIPTETETVLKVNWITNCIKNDKREFNF